MTLFSFNKLKNVIIPVMLNLAVKAKFSTAITPAFIVTWS